MIGGPFDGVKLASRVVEPFMWVDGSRCRRVRAAGSALYRLAGKQGDEVRVMFVENLVELCECGAYRPRAAVCGLCGSGSTL